MTALDDSIRQAIEAYLARSQLSERKLGAFAVGDPALIPRIKAGGSMRLGTADQLLSYMNEAPIGPTFRREVEAFLSETGIGERRFGSKAAGDPSFVTRLRSGASPRLSTVERVQARMRANKDELVRAAIAQTLAERTETSGAPSSEPGAQNAPAAATAEPRSDNESAIEGTTPVQDEPKMFFPAREAAALLTLSPRSLHRFRTTGEGPPYLRLGGRFVYARDDLLEWAWARRHEGTPERT